MTTHTSTHWGVREVQTGPDGSPILVPLSSDPDPSQIGLDQLGPDVQRLRVRRPAIRKSWLDGGPGALTDRRGTDPFVEVDWDTALNLLGKELARVKEAHGNGAIFGGCYGWSSAGRFHHAQSQIHRFLNAFGGYVRHVNSYSLGAAHVVMGHIVEPMGRLMTEHTSWDVIAEHTEMFVSFGGVSLKSTQVSPGGVSRHTARDGLRRLVHRGARIVNIGPVGDNLEAEGTEWIPIRPNTDTAVMIAMCYVLLDEGLLDRSFLQTHCVGFDVYAAYLRGEGDTTPKTPEWAEAISGMPAARIREIAWEMTTRRTMVNMAWALQRASHGEQPCWATVALAAMLGQIGLPGGGFGLGYGSMNVIGSPAVQIAGPTLPQGKNPIAEFIPCARIADMLLMPGQTYPYDGQVRTYPDIRLVYWAGGNPFHHHQDLNRMMQAWEKPETIVVHEQYWTASAKRADIVLPATISLEREDIGYSAREGHLVAMRRIVDPLDEARDDYDILADLAERVGVADGFTEGRDSEAWLRNIYEVARAKNAVRGIALPDFDGLRSEGLILLDRMDAPSTLLDAFRTDPQAHPVSTPSGKIEIFSETVAGFGLEDCPGHPVWREPAEWLGQAGRDGAMMHLISDQPERRLHSQLDASAYSKAGKRDGREPVDMNPSDARERGIADGDVVELSNSRGRCLAVARLTDRLAPGVARLATGAWYEPDATGRDTRGNPNVLTLDKGTSGLAQGSSAQTCLVYIQGPVNDATPLSDASLPDFVEEAKPGIFASML
jgi:biotin/methionine sulfoxide reductase